MIKFTKVRETQSPNRAHDTDAGIDFYCPSKSDEFIADLKGSFTETDDGFTILPQGRILIPSGIHVKFEDSHALIAFNKSGIASKTGLIVGAAVVDSDYEGEVHINLINTSDEPVTICFGQKIVQFILLPIKCYIPEEVDSLDELYKDSKSERKDGGFGSTN